MESHPLETVSPKFSFQVVSKHKDPLSRQLKEAVCIKEEGALNRRNEYQLNELVRLEPSSFIWDELQLDKESKRSNYERENKTKNFIDVMIQVNNYCKKNLTL